MFEARGIGCRDNNSAHSFLLTPVILDLIGVPTLSSGILTGRASVPDLQETLKSPYAKYPHGVIIDLF